jgi:hypothetical protein
MLLVLCDLITGAHIANFLGDIVRVVGETVNGETFVGFLDRLANRNIFSFLLAMVLALIGIIVGLVLLVAVIVVALAFCTIPFILGGITNSDTVWSATLGIELLLVAGLPPGFIIWYSLPYLEPIGLYLFASTVGSWAQIQNRRHQTRNLYRAAKLAYEDAHRKGLTMEIIPRDEVHAVQRRYDELMAKDPRSSNAIVTLAGELSTRLNLSQQTKTMAAWTGFYEQVTRRTLAFDEAVKTFYEVFGHYPADLPDEYRQKVRQQVERKQDTDDFEDEKRLAHQQRERSSWKRRSQREEIEDQAAIARAQTEVEQARLERERIEHERGKLTAVAEQPKQEKTTRESEIVKLRKWKQGRLALAEELKTAGDYDEHAFQVDIEEIDAEFRRRLNEITEKYA